MCDSKKSGFIKEQEASVLLSSLEIRTQKIIQKFIETGDSRYIYQTKTRLSLLSAQYS